MYSRPQVKTKYIFVVISNYKSLLTVYGKDAAQAVKAFLELEAHLMGVTVLSHSDDRFYIDLSKINNSGQLLQFDVFSAQKWIFFYIKSFIKDANCLCIPTISILNIDNINESPIDSCTNFSASETNFPVLRPNIKEGWIDYSRFEKDMRVAITFFRAMFAGQLFLTFQPIATLASVGSILYQEALLRRSPNEEKDQESTSEVVGSLERLGLNRALDYLVVSMTIDLLINNTRLHLGCNISASGLIVDNWWSPILATLRDNPQVAPRLTFEITETSTINHLPDALAFLKQIKKLGCNLALDDFGCGYTPFSLLLDAAPNLVKLRVDLLNTKHKSSYETKKIIDFFHAFDARVVVEGVEQDRDYNTLKKSNCDFVQGFWVDDRFLRFKEPSAFITPQLIGKFCQ